MEHAASLPHGVFATVVTAAKRIERCTSCARESRGVASEWIRGAQSQGVAVIASGSWTHPPDDVWPGSHSEWQKYCMTKRMMAEWQVQAANAAHGALVRRACTALMLGEAR